MGITGVSKLVFAPDVLKLDKSKGTFAIEAPMLDKSNTFAPEAILLSNNRPHIYVHACVSFVGANTRSSPGVHAW